MYHMVLAPQNDSISLFLFYPSVGDLAPHNSIMCCDFGTLVLVDGTATIKS